MFCEHRRRQFFDQPGIAEARQVAKQGVEPRPMFLPQRPLRREKPRKAKHPFARGSAALPCVGILVCAGFRDQLPDPGDGRVEAGGGADLVEPRHRPKHKRRAQVSALEGGALVARRLA